MAEQTSREEGAPSTKVFFGKRGAPTPILPPDAVLVVPSGDSWNDFGHQTRVDVFFYMVPATPPIQISGYLGFVSSDKKRSGRDLLQELLAGEHSTIQANASELQLFTMLPDLAHYRRLVQLVGPDSAKRSLLAINDLVAINEFQPSAEIFGLATKTEVFSLSFMRSADAYFAFKNAGPILRGLASEQVGIVSNSLAIKFHLPGRASEHDLQFDFDLDAEIPKRIAVIIGKNGVGKSQTLGRIARAALDGSAALTNGADGGRPELNRLLAFAPTNESESVFPSEKRRRPKIWYRRCSLNRASRAGRNDHVSDLIAQVARSSESVAGKGRWGIFSQAVRSISDYEQIHLIGTRTGEPFVPMRSLAIGGEQALLERFAAIDAKKEPVRLVEGKGYPLSSGEISFLKFAAQVSLHIENGSLLLLDEPETHLHPNFIARFAELLDRLLELTGSIAIIATHSAYFVREVFQEQVTVLTIDEDQIVQALRPRLKTFGADVGAISYFVFGEDQPSRMAERLRNKLIAKNWTWDVLYERYKDELSLEMLNSLRAKVEDGASD